VYGSAATVTSGICGRRVAGRVDVRRLLAGKGNLSILLDVLDERAAAELQRLLLGHVDEEALQGVLPDAPHRATVFRAQLLRGARDVVERCVVVEDDDVFVLHGTTALTDLAFPRLEQQREQEDA